MQSCRFAFYHSESLSQLIADESFHSILHSLLPLLFQMCIEVTLASVCGHGSSDGFQQHAFKAVPSRDPSLHLSFFQGHLEIFRYPWYLKTFYASIRKHKARSQRAGLAIALTGKHSGLAFKASRTQNKTLLIYTGKEVGAYLINVRRASYVLHHIY